MGNQSSSNGAPPKTMQRLVLKKSDADMRNVVLEVQTTDLPVPKSGEVLIKVAAAAVNPSDYGEWTRSEVAEGGQTIGKEGSGVVVSSGGGFSASGLVGKNVGFVGLPKGQGSYSEYVTVSAMQGTFVLPPSLPVEDAASFFVNPYTAYGIVDTMRAAGSNGLVHTAAASSLGKMMVRLCLLKGVPLINVVRREEQAAMLKALGAKHVVVTTGEKKVWMAELKGLIDELKIKVAFDAIAGEMSGDLLSILPNKGACYVYGGLSGQPVAGINPLDLIYRRKQLKGWLLTNWVRTGGMISTVRRLRTAAAVVNPGLAKGGWCASEFVDVPMEKMWDTFLDMYTTSGFTGRKLRMRMSAGKNQASKGWQAACTPEGAEDGASSKEAAPADESDNVAPKAGPADEADAAASKDSAAVDEAAVKVVVAATEKATEKAEAEVAAEVPTEPVVAVVETDTETTSTEAVAAPV